MPQIRVETLDGGITQVIVEKSESASACDLEQSLSQASRKLSHMLVNLLNLEHIPENLIDHLGKLKGRTKIKVVSTHQEVIKCCNQTGLTVFPSVKSAALAFAGEKTLELLRRKLGEVPVLNTEAYQLIADVSSPDASFQTIENKVKDNAGLCGQIFKWANSSYFARKTKAETLNQALNTLGLTNLRQLFIHNLYKNVGGLFSAQKEVMDHGRKCAVLAEYIARSGGAPAEECAKVRMGGLLHDIGRQALAFSFPDHYEKVRRKIRDEKMASNIAELLVFGTEHQTVGSLLCTLWNFPSYLAAIIGDHHHLKAENWNTLTLPIFCANNFLNEIDGMPFSPWFQKLEGYFFLKRKDLPWKDVAEEFKDFLAHQDQGIFNGA